MPDRLSKKTNFNFNSQDSSERRRSIPEEKSNRLLAKLKNETEAKERQKELDSRSILERPAVITNNGRDLETLHAARPSLGDIAEFHTQLMADSSPEEYNNLLKWLGYDQNKKSGFDK